MIWPLLPDRALDPWGVLNPASLWKFVVLVMAVGAAGHVALRVVGARWGLPLAGFSGFASSTAAVAPAWGSGPGYSEIGNEAASAALLANLASYLLFVVVVGAGSVALLRSVGWALAGELRGAAGGEHRASGVPPTRPSAPGQPTAGGFPPELARRPSAPPSRSSLLVGVAQEVFGDSGALVTAGIAALAELHASAASISQLAASEDISMQSARWASSASWSRAEW